MNVLIILFSNINNIMNYTPIFNFKANNYINAYILNAICASLSAVIAIKLHAYGEKRKNQCKQGMHNHFCSFYKKGLYTIIAVIITTFISTIIIYLCMNILFGYGGGMIAN